MLPALLSSIPLIAGDIPAHLISTLFPNLFSANRGPNSKPLQLPPWISLLVMILGMPTFLRYLWAYVISDWFYIIPSIRKYVVNMLLKYYCSSMEFSWYTRNAYRINKFLLDEGLISSKSRLRVDDDESFIEDSPTKRTAGKKSNYQWPVSSSGRTSIRFEPRDEASKFFIWNGCLYLWQVDEEVPYDPDVWWVEKKILYCFSRSQQPNIDLIAAALDHHEKKSSATTTITRPAPAKRRRECDDPWADDKEKPRRAIESVILNEDQKVNIIADIEEYLSIATKKWYANRGLPYRRGYLFVGPPGTGKTSLTFALAGVFQLDIYLIPLHDQTITEEDLTKLFDTLPRRCIVLLEDIDAVGIQKRTNLKELSATAQPEGTATDTATVVSTSTPAKDSSKDAPDATNSTEAKPRISLAGLLNIIDGVAASEGRVLIMTTNKAESLDPALTRPGRIDLTLHFHLASQSDAAQLFVQIFQDPAAVAAAKESASENYDESESKSGLTGWISKSALSGKVSDDATKIERLAAEFSSKIPNHVFGQADLQGYMMLYKNKPEEAVANIEAWVAQHAKIKEIEVVAPAEQSPQDIPAEQAAPVQTTSQPVLDTETTVLQNNGEEIKLIDPEEVILQEVHQPTTSTIATPHLDPSPTHQGEQEPVAQHNQPERQPQAVAATA